MLAEIEAENPGEYGDVEAGGRDNTKITTNSNPDNFTFKGNVNSRNFNVDIHGIMCYAIQYGNGTAFGVHYSFKQID